MPYLKMHRLLCHIASITCWPSACWCPDSIENIHGEEPVSENKQLEKLYLDPLLLLEGEKPATQIVYANLTTLMCLFGPQRYKLLHHIKGPRIERQFQAETQNIIGNEAQLSPYKC